MGDDGCERMCKTPRPAVSARPVRLAFCTIAGDGDDGVEVVLRKFEFELL